MRSTACGSTAAFSRARRPPLKGGVAGSPAGECLLGSFGALRLLNYLKAVPGDRRHNMLFVGYQAMGTPGRAIQKHRLWGGYVDLDGERFEVRAC